MTTDRNSEEAVASVRDRMQAMFRKTGFVTYSQSEDLADIASEVLREHAHEPALFMVTAGQQFAVIEGDPRGPDMRIVCYSNLPAGTKLYTTPPATIPAAEMQALVERWEKDIAEAGPFNKKDLRPARFVRELAKLIPRNPE